jgi:hypothetical protein
VRAKIACQDMRKEGLHQVTSVLLRVTAPADERIERMSVSAAERFKRRPHLGRFDGAGAQYDTPVSGGEARRAVAVVHESNLKNRGKMASSATRAAKGTQQRRGVRRYGALAAAR